MRQRERVAELRRQLPEGATVDDFVFQEGPADLDAGDTQVRPVRLSELFTGPGRSLVIHHLMYGKRQTSPSPMSTTWIDGFNGAAPHLAQNLNVAIAAATDPPAQRAHARNRSWRNLRLLSGGDSSFKYDLGSEHDQATRTRPSRSSPATAGASCATSPPPTRERPTTSTNAASTRSARSGTSSTSPHRAGGVPPFAFNCDIATPMVRQDDAVFAVDLWLDVLVRSDGTTHGVYDHHEFDRPSGMAG